MMNSMRFKPETLRKFTVEILDKAGYRGEEAKIFADSLIMANESGVDSHGITRLRTYAERIRHGVVDIHAEPEIVNDADTFIMVDSRNGMGVATCRWTIDRCIERAKKHGSCFAAVRNGNHFGTGAFHTMYGAEQGMLTIAMSNSSACVAPTGGRTAILGTNPMSIAIPSEKYGAMILDMATCTVAQGKVILANKEGNKIPFGWAIDEKGNPTDDPAAALKGAMLPFGGPKGYGISLIIEILCSALTGAYMSPDTKSFWRDFENPQGLGFFMGVLDISKILPLDEFKKRTDEILDRIKNSPKAEGVSEIFIPGEIEQRNRKLANESGIELGSNVYSELVALANEYGVSADILKPM